MATFGLFVPSVGSTSVQYLFHTYILGPSLPLNWSNFAKTANLPAMATFVGLIFSRLGRIWAHLGPILDRLGHLCWSILAHLGAILVPSWPTSAPSCTIVAPSWAHLGPILAPSCPILAPSLSFLGHFLQQLLSCPSLSNFLSNFSLSAGSWTEMDRTKAAEGNGRGTTKTGPRLGKTGPEWAQDGATMVQDGAEVGQDGTKMAPRWAI